MNSAIVLETISIAIQALFNLIEHLKFVFSERELDEVMADIQKRMNDIRKIQIDAEEKENSILLHGNSVSIK